MNAAPDHLDPKEATEAKLCAYLEGELGPQEQAEIERHLQANPQHRQLLTELVKTRDWIRLLPRESAPPEIVEAFEAQVERSMLLDSHRDPTVSAMSRFPQYALLAAIVLLIAGLGVIIVSMLRTSGTYTLAPTTASSGGQVAGSKGAAMMAPAMMSRSISSTRPSTDLDTDHPAVAFAVPSAPGLSAPMASAAGGSIAAASRRRDAIDKALTVDQKAAEAVVEKPFSKDDSTKDTDAVKAKLMAAGVQIPSIRKTVCLVVSTPAPAATANQIRNFFMRNQVVYDDNNAVKLVQPQPAPSATSIFAQAQKEQDRQPSLAMKQPTTAPMPVIISATSETQIAKIDAADTSTDTERAYIGHALTPLQLELLHGTLATGGIDQTVKRLSLADPIAMAKPTTAPVINDAVLADISNKITNGQTLTVTVPQLVGPGIQKTNIVKVTDDGMVSLPMLDPVPATGASPTQLQDRIAGKYRDANLISQATVTVTVNAPAIIAPTTQSATSIPSTTQPVVTIKSPSTQPIETAAGILAMGKPVVPATQPASTQPIDDGKIDVVVYVEKSTR